MCCGPPLGGLDFSGERNEGSPEPTEQRPVPILRTESYEKGHQSILLSK